MKIKTLLISCLTIACASQASAQELSASQALNRFLNGGTDKTTAARAKRAKAVNKMKLTYTSELQDRNTYYVFDNTLDGGYVILSADATMPAVLGVVDAGKFDYDNIPENMKFYLQTLDANVRAQARRGVVAKALAGKEAIAPLLGATEWDQGKPYNLMTPVYDYGKNGQEQAFVGCVACATAQVMRYHKYPQTGIGERTYNFLWDCKEGEDQQVATDSVSFSTNFAEHTYDWDNMLDKYTENPANWTTEQGNAIATLFKDVGVASKMRYGTSASGGSGTQTYEAGRGLVDYFGYDASLQFINHKFYTNDEWDEIIYGEIAGNRPVIFGGCGANGSGGHEYVGDGWDADGKCHINWGWSGSNNGYFFLTGPGMIPAGSGSGGAESGSSYGYNQDALIHIMPSNDQAATGQESNCRLATIGYTCKTNDLKLTLTGKFYNTSYRERADTAGVQIQASDGTNYNFVDNACNIDSDSPMNSIDVTIEGDIPAGEYTIVPIMKGPDDENWAEIKVLSTFKAATLTVADGEDGKKTISVTNNDAPKIEAEGAVTTNKKSFRPTKKNDDGTLDAETLVLTCEKGIKNCDSQGQKLSFGCEFYDLTESNDSTDVYWLSNYAKTNADELAPGASIKTISVEILPELKAGHSYEINPIFYTAIDESLDDNAYFDALDNLAQYVNLGNNEAPVIEIEDDGTAIKSATTATKNTKATIYDANGRILTNANINNLPVGVYIVKDERGVRKVVRK